MRTCRMAHEWYVRKDTDLGLRNNGYDNDRPMCHSGRTSAVNLLLRIQMLSDIAYLTIIHCYSSFQQPSRG